MRRRYLIKLIVLCGFIQIFKTSSAITLKYNFNFSALKHQKADTVFKRVDILPSFKGGNGALYKIVDANLKYPEEAKNKGIEGKVIIEFIVDRNGKVSNARVFRGVNKQLDEEAVRVVNMLPRWIPGSIDNKPVPSYVKMPIHCKLKNKN